MLKLNLPPQNYKCKKVKPKHIKSREKAQAVSRKLPISVVRYQPSGICGRIGIGAGFIRVPLLHPSISFNRLLKKRLSLMLHSSWTSSLHKNTTPWSESARELYRPRDRSLSAKLVPTFADRGCHMVSVTDPYGRILGFLDRSRYFSIK
jgi:hypothetical protein